MSLMPKKVTIRKSKKLKKMDHNKYKIMEHILAEFYCNYSVNINNHNKNNGNDDTYKNIINPIRFILWLKILYYNFI